MYCCGCTENIESDILTKLRFIGNSLDTIDTMIKNEYSKGIFTSMENIDILLNNRRILIDILDRLDVNDK